MKTGPLFATLPNRNQYRSEQTEEYSCKAALTASQTGTTGARIHRTDAVGRIIRRRLRAVHCTVPAELLEAAGAHVRDLRLRTLKASLEYGTAHTGGPSGVHGGITHGRDRVAVEDHVIAFAGIIGGIES